MTTTPGRRWDPRFVCPECGRAPLGLHDGMILHEEGGRLIGSVRRTCINGHTWSAPPDSRQLQLWQDLARNKLRQVGAPP